MNEDPSGEERAINQTRSGIVSVPGPATSDPYSTQGDSSDEEGGRENGYLRSLQVCNLLPKFCVLHGAHEVRLWQSGESLSWERHVLIGRGMIVSLLRRGHE